MNRWSRLSIAVFLLSMPFAINAAAQLELSSGDKIYLPSGNETIGDSIWTVYRIPLVYGIDQDPIQIKNLNDGFIIFNWKIDKRRSSRIVDIYKNDFYLTSCMNNSWLSTPLRYKINSSDNLSLHLGSSNLKGGLVEIRFLLQEQVQLDHNPSIPMLQLESNTGYNNTPIRLYLQLEQPHTSKIRYILDWGDNNTSSTDLLSSNKTEPINHSWSKAQTYEVRVKAIDELGRESGWSQAKNIKIDWLVKVPPDAQLQTIIDRLSANTTVLLDGADYDGPIEICDLNNINISSNNTRSKIKNKATDENYVLGVVNATSITINSLGISGDKGIGLKDCKHCKVIDNDIYFKIHGIGMVGGHDNIIEKNNIYGSNIKEDDNGCAGVSLEDTLNDSIVCNSIDGIDISKSEYYVRNSTFSIFKVIVPLTSKNIVQYNPSRVRDSNGETCCGSYNKDRNWMWEACIYKSEETKRSICVANLTVEKCE